MCETAVQRRFDRASHLQTRSTPWAPKRRSNSAGGQRRALYEASSHRPQTTSIVCKRLFLKRLPAAMQCCSMQRVVQNTSQAQHHSGMFAVAAAALRLAAAARRQKHTHCQGLRRRCICGGRQRVRLDSQESKFVFSVKHRLCETR